MFFLTHEGRYTDNIRRQIVYNLRDARTIMKARIPESIEKQSFIRIDALDGVYREGERVNLPPASLQTDGEGQQPDLESVETGLGTQKRESEVLRCPERYGETRIRRRLHMKTPETD